MKYRELLAWARDFLKENDIEEYESDAWLLFEKAFAMDRARYFLMQNEDILQESTAYDGEVQACESEAIAGCGSEPKEILNNAETFRTFVKRRALKEPLQHITGVQNFMGYDFKVTPDVLIPRFDTEILVEQTLKGIEELNTFSDNAVKILDMCTGSGCIAISLVLLAKKKGIDVKTCGADISDKALLVARENADRLSCENVHFVQSDLFENISGERFDIIVSNPPYIETDVIEELAPEVKNHEPRLALDGMADGLHFYRRIINAAGGYLSEGGRIYFEIGYNQAEAVSTLLCEAGFKDVKVIKDLAGLNRVVAAGKE